MELLVNPIFCDKMFGVIFGAMLVSLSGTPRWPLHFLIKMCNICSPKLLNKMLLRCCSFSRCAVLKSP